MMIEKAEINLSSCSWSDKGNKGMDVNEFKNIVYNAKITNF